MNKQNTLQTVTLPENLQNGRENIYQDSHALGVTSATAALYEYIQSNYCETKLRVIEAGSGSGILSIMLQLAHPDWDITGLEIQASLHSLSEANAASLQLSTRYLCADLRSYRDEYSYDLAVSNPPWQKCGQGWVSPHPERAISRTELCCTMPDLLAFCARNIGYNKQAVLMYPNSRRQELINEAEKVGFCLINCAIVDKSTTIFHLQKG